MTILARARYSGYRFPAEVISHAVWLYFCFPPGLRMVEELLAARGIIVGHDTVRQWARKIWPAVRQPDPSSAPADWRQMASKNSRSGRKSVAQG
jgi:transposase-like protein